MRRLIIFLVTQTCFVVSQSLPSLAQVVPPASVQHIVSMPHLAMPIQLHGIATPIHNHDANQEHNTTTSTHNHIYHHFWQHQSDAQNNNQQQNVQINLNLSSSNASMTAGHLLYGRTITIDVGGQKLSVTNNTPLTSSEYMAVMQVVHNGQQTIALDSQGQAVGGTVVINSRLSNELNSLVVPQGVTVIDLSSSGKLNLSGGIIDNGNFYISSFNHSLSSIAINTNNITVESHGTISDIVSPGTLSWLNKADANLSLDLNVLNGINNAGTILSGGNLTLTTSGSVVNSGLIQSTHGNINVTVPSNNIAQSLNVQSFGGTWQAANGNINFGNTAATNSSINETFDLNLTGGNYLSQQLNINLGGGFLNAAVQNVTGVVNADAGAARLVSSTPDLQIGNWNIDGDPTIANDNTITLTGNIFMHGAPVTIVSGQNVVSFNPITINTSSGITSGGNVNIIAGAVFTPDPYSSGPISILGASATGGSINLNLIGNGINTQAFGNNSAGGNVVLAAFAGGSHGSGSITLPASSSISTGGTGNGSPGHVYVMAGANTGSASAPGISIGTINTVSANESGGPGSSGLAGGHIVLSTEQPNASINNPWVIDPSNGTPLVGGPLGGATADAPISVTGITTGGGQIDVFSGLGITVGNNSTIGTNVISTTPAANSTFPGGMVSLIANAYGNTSASINTDIIVNGNIVTSGPALGNGTGIPQSGNFVAMTTGSVITGNITTSNTAITSSFAGSSGGSGYIVAGSNSTIGQITTGNINTSSQFTQSGSIELISMANGSGAGSILVGSINTSSTNSSGAAITISSPGTITVTGAIDSHGGNGDGGSLFIGSGVQSGTAINVANGLTINTSGTGTDGGVYLLAGNAGDTITHGTITTVPIEVISAYNPTTTSITGGAGLVQVIFGTDSGTSTLSTYSPGGYSQINDQVGTPGGVTLVIQTANGDPNVIVPIISLNSPLTLLGASGSSSLLQSIDSSGKQSGYSLLSPNGISIGSSNATLFSFPTLHTYIGLIASNHGSVDVDNSNGGALQPISLDLAASASGPLSVFNNATLNISNAVSASSSTTLGAGVVLGLILSGSVSSASAITLVGVGSLSVSVAQSGPGTIGGATLNLINVNSSTTLDTDVAYLNVDTYTNSSLVISNSNNVNVSVPQSGSFELSSGGQINLTGPSAATSEFSLSTNSDIAISQNLTVTGPNARIDLKSGNTIIIGDGVVINAAGTSSSGGLIQLASSIANGPLTVVNNGIIETSNTNNTSIVGFNSGSSLYINVTGIGAIVGSQVNFGNLDPNTLNMQGPFSIFASPFTASIRYGNIYIQQGFVLATAGLIRISTPISSSSLPLYYTQQQNQQNIRNEQIGTKIATDNTPWTTYWRQPLLYPKQSLQGGISIDKVSQNNSALFAASEFNANELTALSRAGIIFGSQSHDNFFALEKGSVLFMPNKDIDVQTLEGIAHIPKGAAAWIVETGKEPNNPSTGHCAIYDMHDTIHTGAIKVSVDKKELVLAPGKELLLTRNYKADFVDLNPSKALGYRNVGSTDLGNGIKAFICDFSIVHGMVNVPVVHSLVSSKDPVQRRAARQMFKNAAILAELTGDSYSN